MSLLCRYYSPATGQFLSLDPLVDGTGQPFAYVGNDPVNQADPSGEVRLLPSGYVGDVCSSGRLPDFAYTETCAHRNPCGQSMGCMLNVAASVLLAAGSAVSIDDFVGLALGVRDLVGGSVAGGIRGVLGSMRGLSSASGAGAEGGAGGSNVLLDTNAAIRYNDARGLIEAGEQPVVTQSVQQELADVAARKGFSGQLPAGVGLISDEQGALIRAQVLEAMRGFGAAEQGIDVDAFVGATALSGPYPLITADDALGNALAKLGGDWRPLP